jgi:hypothetical protein
MSQVRFQVLFGPASLHPRRMSWPLPAGVEEALGEGEDAPAWVERLRPSPQGAVDVAAGGSWCRSIYTLRVTFSGARYPGPGRR